MARYWPLSTGRIVPSHRSVRAMVDSTLARFRFPRRLGRPPLYARASGTVIHAGAAQGYGEPDPAGWLVIDHPQKLAVGAPNTATSSERLPVATT